MWLRLTFAAWPTVFGHNASYNLHAYMPHSFDEVYQHIAQLAPLFHANADVIHALQTGFVRSAPADDSEPCCYVPLLSLSRALAVQIGEAGEWVIPNNDKVNSSQLWLSKPGISEMVARQLYELLPPDRMVLIRSETTPTLDPLCAILAIIACRDHQLCDRDHQPMVVTVMTRADSC